jgi:hypothetical protein
VHFSFHSITNNEHNSGTIEIPDSSDEDAHSAQRPAGTKTTGETPPPSPTVPTSTVHSTTSMESMNGETFRARAVEKVLQIMLDGTPTKTQPAAIGVLENLSSKESNTSKTILSSRIINGNTGPGMSQDIANVLVCAEKIRKK